MMITDDDDDFEDEQSQPRGQKSFEKSEHSLHLALMSMQDNVVGHQEQTLDTLWQSFSVVINSQRVVQLFTLEQ